MTNDRFTQIFNMVWSRAEAVPASGRRWDVILYDLPATNVETAHQQIRDCIHQFAKALNKDEDELFSNMFKKAFKIMCLKSQEYSFENDKLYNFKRSCALFPHVFKRPSQACLAFSIKHAVSCTDILTGKLSEKYLDEKLLDLLNYIVLMMACQEEDWS